jgi:hypothetical protein
MRNHPGVNEIEWLADLKTLAETIGARILGTEIRWVVESNVQGTKTRADVRIESDSGEVLLTGEAKRPDTKEGVHPLVTGEVNNAVEKAQMKGAPLAFTTNFYSIAVLDSGPGMQTQPQRRLQGDLIPFIDPSLDDRISWWAHLSNAERIAAATPGLEGLFNRIKMIRAGHTPNLSVDDMALDYFATLTELLLGPLSTKFDSEAEALPSEIHQRALNAGLDIKNPQERRYLVAQGIAEVLTATLFHRLLRDHFGALPSLMGGTQPSKAAKVAQAVQVGLSEAVQVSGDYKPILVLSPIGEWVLKFAPVDSVAHWLALFDFIERLDVDLVSTDILGTIFERLISPERRHDLGQHYTQPRLARAMAKWGVTGPDTVVLDPACGAGTFLVETYQIQKAMGVGHDQILRQTFGNDLDSFAVHLASINLATQRVKHGLNHPLIREGDAFSLAPDTVNMLHVYAQDGVTEDIPLQRADLIIANPPYARSTMNEAAYLAHLVSLGLTQRPATTGINIAAWFVMLGVALAKPSAKLAFVLPSAVLQNENLAEWRAWLRRRYDMVLWHTEEDVWFSDARVATIVMLLTPRPAQRSSDNGQVKFVSCLEPVDGSLQWHGGVPAPCGRVEIRDLSSEPGSGDLLIPGTMPDIAAKFASAKAVRLVDQVDGMKTQPGQKLGHGFFRLTDMDPTGRTVLRTVKGLGTTFKLNRSHLTPLLGGAKEIETGEPTLQSTWLLTAPRERPASSTALGSYIRLGESQGVHEQPSVRSRHPWWSIEARRFNMAVTMNAAFRHQVAWFKEPASANNNFNTITLADKTAGDAELVAASLASGFGALDALYVSGEIGCEGVRRVLLTHIQRWSTLDPHLVTDKTLRRECLDAYRTYRKHTVPEYDQMPNDVASDFYDLTVAVAACALGSKSAPAEDLATQALAALRETISRRRVREALALAGRTRTAGSSGARTPASRVRNWVKGVPAYEIAIELATGGNDVSKLRTIVDIESPTLFSSSALHGFEAEEAALTSLLGAGFEGAWPDAVTNYSDLERLTETLASLFAQGDTDLLGEQPPQDSPAFGTWNQLQGEMHTSIRRMMQAAIRDGLS